MERDSGIHRRTFLKGASTTLALALGGELLSLSALRPASAQINPLADYPDRDWERLYRDVYAHDDSFVFMCTPNCTHNCYLKAYVRNGVITRCGPSQRFNEATDLYGTKATQRWDPRHCNKGLAVVRRFTGDRRVKGPMVRRGFRKWVEQGFPRDERGLPRHYRIGPARFAPSHPSFVHSVQTFSGVGLMPYAPAHLSARRDEVAGDLAYRWIRTGRYGADSWQGVDIPLTEDRVAYRVRLLSGGVLLREVEVSAPDFIYTAAIQAADGAGSALEARVAQLSTSFGYGPERVLITNE